ncbi:MAG: hypothetical protein GY777_24295 [Candidatus Brocadiaceae bacterium]|nr:hypothetical protein [Candidatus Brocadiaceae bacterium]
MANIGELYVDIRANNTQANTAMDKTGAKAKKLGDNLNKFVTLPLLAMGVASVKFASDAEETNAKFNTAFKGIQDSANETATNLARDFGLAQSTAENLLGSTGDLIKGFGGTETQALNTSKTIQELAVDLSSYNNLQGGATQASEILTKAFLGERDSLISLGIKISDADVKQRLLETGQQNLTGQALLLARGNITLELAMKQSGDAIGDYARTSDSAANQTKLLGERAKDLAVAFGKELLPTYTELVSKTANVLEKFADMDNKTKKTTLTIAGLSIAIAPAIKGVTALKIAFTGLATAPLGAIVAIAGLTVGVLSLINAQTGLIDKFKESRRIQKAFENGTVTLQDKLAVNKRAYSEVGEELVKYRKKLNESTSKHMIDFYRNKIILLSSEADGIHATTLKIEAEIKAIQDEADAVAETARKKEEARINELMAIEEAKLAETELARKQEEILAEQLLSEKEKAQALSDLAEEWEQKRFEQSATELELLEDEKNKAIELAEGQADIIANIEETYALKTDALKIKLDEEEASRIEALKQKKIQAFSEYSSHATGIINSIATIMQNVDKEESQRLDQSLKEDIAALEQKGLSEEEFNNQKRELEKETAKKKYELTLKEFNANKGIAIIEAGIATALGIAKSLPNLILAGVVGAAGVVQVAAIASQPAPPKPAFAKGGVATKATEAIVGEAGGEVMYGMGAAGDPLVVAHAERTAEIIAKSLENNGSTVNVYYSSTFGLQDERQIEEAGRKLYDSIQTEGRRRGAK